MGLIRIGVMALMVLFLMVDFSFCQNTAGQILTKGVEHAAQGNFTEARGEFEKALEVDPFWESAKTFLKIIEDVNQQEIKAKTAISYFKGVAYALKGRWVDAIDEYNKTLTIDPRFPMAFNARGRANEKNGQYDEAIADFTKAIEINPRYAAAYLNRGGAYGNKGQHDKAIVDFSKAIEINSKYVKAYDNRGLAYFRKDQPNKAISDYNKAIEINPRFAKAYMNRGVAYAYKGQYDKAISDYTKAIEINPKYASAYYNRGLVYMVRLGNKKKACSDWKKACELGICENYDLAKNKGDCK